MIIICFFMFVYLFAQTMYYADNDCAFIVYFLLNFTSILVLHVCICIPMGIYSLDLFALWTIYIQPSYLHVYLVIRNLSQGC